jgi:hypothetical protein
VGLRKVPVAAVQLSVCGPKVMALLMATPSTSETATTGIVMAGVPATVGLKRPAELLYSTTAAAPASRAFLAFS